MSDLDPEPRYLTYGPAACLAAIGLLLVALVLSTLPAGATEPTRTDAGTRTCTTSSTGYCTVTHDLGVVPTAVVVTAQAPIGGNRIVAALDADRLTAATFRVRAFTPTGGAFVGTLTLSYVAATGPAAPPTTTPPATTTAPPTTTPPPTTTSPPPGSWPTAATTGVPAGTSLTTVGTDLTVDTDGATVDARDVQGSVIVNANDVTITRTKIHGVVFNCGACTGLRLVDTEITANPGQTHSIGNFPPITGDYSLMRVHVHGWQDGPRTAFGTVSIVDSLSDDLAFASGEHPDAVQQYCPGCEVHVTIQHSTLSGCAGNSTDRGNSALFWSDHPGVNSTLTLVNNRVSCGQFTIRVNDTGSGIAGNSAGVVADVRDNVVVRGSYAFGPAECDNSRAFDATRGDGVKWSGNVYDDGAPIDTPCAA